MDSNDEMLIDVNKKFAKNYFQYKEVEITVFNNLMIRFDEFNDKKFSTDCV